MRDTRSRTCFQPFRFEAVHRPAYRPAHRCCRSATAGFDRSDRNQDAMPPAPTLSRQIADSGRTWKRAAPPIPRTEWLLRAHSDRKPEKERQRPTLGGRPRHPNRWMAPKSRLPWVRSGTSPMRPPGGRVGRCPGCPRAKRRV